MTFIYELDLHIFKMYLHTKNELPRSVFLTQTHRQIRPNTLQQPHLRVVAV